MSYKIYKIEGTFTIADDGGWKSGIYDSEATAIFAIGLSDKDLQRLQDEKNKTTSVITMDDLKALSAMDIEFG